MGFEVGIPFSRIIIRIEGEPLSLLELGQLLSNTIFAGVPFVEPESSLRDEVPAISLAKKIMGMDVVLYGHEEDLNFRLAMTCSGESRTQVKEAGRIPERIDLGNYLGFLINMSIPGVRAENAMVY